MALELFLGLPQIVLICIIEDRMRKNELSSGGSFGVDVAVSYLGLTNTG